MVALEAKYRAPIPDHVMLKRFLHIKTELSAIVELLTLFPNHFEVDILSRGCVTMKKFDSVTIMRQRDGMTFVE